MSKKLSERRPTLLESKIFKPTEIEAMQANGYKAVVSAAHQDPDAWQWHKKAVYHEAARAKYIDRDLAVAEAERFVTIEWAKGPLNTMAMTDRVYDHLKNNGFRKKNGEPWPEPTVRGWIYKLNPNPLPPGRPRDE
jgi:hypothetical protein